MFKQRFAANVEGVMGVGGWKSTARRSRPTSSATRSCIGREPDRWASPVTYVSLQMLQQAIERVGKIDRAAIIKEMQTGTFDTDHGQDQARSTTSCTIVWWVGQWQDGEFVGLAPHEIRRCKARRAVPKPAWKP